MPLNPRQLKFVEGYLAGKSAKRAYMDAGYDAREHVAEVNAERLLRNAEIQAMIREANAKAAETMELTAEWVLARLRKEAERDGEGASHSARVRALELLGKRLRLFPDSHEHSGPHGKPVPIAVLGPGQRLEDL